MRRLFASKHMKGARKEASLLNALEHTSKNVRIVMSCPEREILFMAIVRVWFHFSKSPTLHAVPMYC
jgi:hypothetical protein